MKAPCQACPTGINVNLVGESVITRPRYGGGDHRREIHPIRGDSANPDDKPLEEGTMASAGM